MDHDKLLTLITLAEKLEGHPSLAQLKSAVYAEINSFLPKPAPTPPGPATIPTNTTYTSDDPQLPLERKL